jgi:hypothetical protein
VAARPAAKVSTRGHQKTSSAFFEIYKTATLEWEWGAYPRPTAPELGDLPPERLETCVLDLCADSCQHAAHSKASSTGPRHRSYSWTRRLVFSTAASRPQHLGPGGAEATTSWAEICKQVNSIVLAWKSKPAGSSGGDDTLEGAEADDAAGEPEEIAARLASRGRG